MGEVSLITGISVAEKAGALAVKAAELKGEEVFGGGHVPYFARQGLRNMADRPVAAYSDTLTDYDESNLSLYNGTPVYFTPDFEGEIQFFRFPQAFSPVSRN